MSGDNQDIFCGQGPTGIIYPGVRDVREFGAVPDFDPVTRQGTDNQLAIQSAIDYCAARGLRLRIAGGLFGVWNNGAAQGNGRAPTIQSEGAYRGTFAGGLDLVSGSIIEWVDDGSWLVQMHPSSTGSFLSNANTGIFHGPNVSAIDYSGDNIALLNPCIDGSYMELWQTPLDEILGEFCNDNGIGLCGHGATVTDRHLAKNIRIDGGHIKGYMAMAWGHGGRGLAFERGVDGVLVSGLQVSDCTYATSVLYNYDDPDRLCRGIRMLDINVIRCGMALLYWGYSSEPLTELPKDSKSAWLTWRGTAWCTGHHPDFIRTDYQEKAIRSRKCTVVCLMAPANADIDIKVFNPDNYPSAECPGGGTRFPVSTPNFTDNPLLWGALTKNFDSSLGSVVSGYGANINLNAEYTGLADSLWSITLPFRYGVHGANFRPINAQGLNLDITSDGRHRLYADNDAFKQSYTAAANLDPGSYTLKLTEEETLSPVRDYYVGASVTVNEKKYVCREWEPETQTLFLTQPLGSAIPAGTKVSLGSPEGAGLASATSTVQGNFVFRSPALSGTEPNPYLGSSSVTRLKKIMFTIRRGESVYNVPGNTMPLPAAYQDRFFEFYESLGTKSVTTSAIFMNGSINPDPLAQNTAIAVRVNQLAQNINPALNDSYSLGGSGTRWDNLYVKNPPISASDARLKTDITEPEDTLLRAWGKVRFKVFRFRDSLEKKGEKSRLHIGLIAQEVREAFASEGLNADAYGFFCHDAWEEKPPLLDGEGNEMQVGMAKGDVFSIRYEEALAIEAAYLRWMLEKLLS